MNYRHCRLELFSTPVLVPHRSAHFVCLFYLTHLIQIISFLVDLIRETCREVKPETSPETRVDNH